jgi:hypothetical protein
VRSAPTHGYDFGNKRQYRRDVWATARKWAGPERSSLNVLLMPSSEGDEVDVALRAGFREERLFLVDRNPAIAAHMKRRYPRARCLGVDVDRAATRLAREGVRIQVANLDLCSPADWASSIASSVVSSGAIDEAALVFVTYLKGRERAGALPVMRKCVATMGGRSEEWPGIDASDTRGAYVLLGASLGPFGQGRKPERVRVVWRIRSGEYRSTAGSQVMGWVAFSILQDLQDDDAKSKLVGRLRRVGNMRVAGALKEQGL